MFILPTDYVIAVWLLASLGCAVWVAVDISRSIPAPVVMKWGVIVAYPVTVWMVSAGINHGMMPPREPGGKFDVPVMGATAGRSVHASINMADDRHAGPDLASKTWAG